MDAIVLHLQSLLSEYDAIVVNLQDEIFRFKTEHEELKKYILNVVDDNHRLNDELRVNVQTRMVSVSHNEVEKDLQHQLELASEAKEMVLEMWQLALQEIERLENFEKSIMPQPETQWLQSKSVELKQDYSKALEIMNKELTTHKEDLRLARSKLIVLCDENERLKHLSKQLEESVSAKEKEVSISERKFEQMQPRIVELEAELVSTQSRLMQVQQELAKEKERNNILGEAIDNHKIYRLELESREADAIQRAKESVQIVESALLEKDTAIVKEQQAVQELKGLQNALDEVVQMAAERAKEEINNIKHKCNKSVKQLLEEVQTLEKDNNEKQALIERAIREKRAAETELTTLCNDGFQKDPQDTSLFRDLSLRLMQVERERDDFKTKADNINAKLQFLEKSSMREDSFLKFECKQLTENLKQVQTSFLASDEERIQLTEEVQRLNQCFQDSEAENVLLRKKVQQEVSRMEKSLLQQQAVYATQIQKTQRKHQSSILELRNLVDAQQYMSDRWKDEVRLMSERFEKEIKDLNLQLLRKTDANSKLSTMLTELQQKTSMIERQKNKHAAEVSELKSRLEEFSKAGLIL